MHEQANEPPLLTAEVEEHPDRRRSPRISAEDIRAELRVQTYPHLLDCICENFSTSGILVLVDLEEADEGDRVSVNLIGKNQRVMELTGRIIRSERTTHFTKIAIVFDGIHENNPILRRLAESDQRD